MFGDQRQDGWDPEDPEEATIEDIVGVLDPACRFVRHVRACRVEVPEWANKDQKVRNAVKETTTAVCLQSAANVEDEEETEWSDEELEAEERNSSETPCKCDDCRVERGTKDVEIRHREHTTEEIWDDGAWRLNTWEPRQKQLWERSIDEKWDSFYALPPLM